LSIEIQKSSGSQCIIFNSLDSVYKVAYTIGSVRQLRHEYICNQAAQLDKYWSKYVVSLFYPITGVLGSKLQKQKASLNDEALKEFLESRYRWILDQPRVCFYDAVDCQELRKVAFQDISLSLIERIEKFIRSFPVEVGSIHGDFHVENIFINDQKIFLIDWGNYHTKFWGKYDLYHLLFCDYVEKNNTSWVDNIAGFYNYQLENSSLMKFKVPKEDMICYTLSRCELEILQDIRLNRLKDSRIKKYKLAIEKLDKFL
jgi:hypothetical protein